MRREHHTQPVGCFSEKELHTSCQEQMATSRFDRYAACINLPENLAPEKTTKVGNCVIVIAVYAWYGKLSVMRCMTYQLLAVKPVLP